MSFLLLYGAASWLDHSCGSLPLFARFVLLAFRIAFCTVGVAPDHAAAFGAKRMALRWHVTLATAWCPPYGDARVNQELASVILNALQLVRLRRAARQHMSVCLHKRLLFGCTKRVVAFGPWSGPRWRSCLGVWAVKKGCKSQRDMCVCVRSHAGLCCRPRRKSLRDVFHFVWTFAWFFPS